MSRSLSHICPEILFTLNTLKPLPVLANGNFKTKQKGGVGGGGVGEGGGTYSVLFFQ